jgi:hypothetical protein
LDVTRPALLAIGLLVAVACRLDKLVKPALHDRLLVTPVALEDSAHSGSSEPVMHQLTLASADDATLAWTALTTAPWLELSASGGGAPGSVTVTLLADTLAQSVRHDTIAFVAAEIPGDTIRIPVTFHVLAPAPALSLSRSTYADSAFAGSLAPRSFVVYIANTGGLPLTWSAAADSGWLTLSADSGGAPPTDSIVVSLSASGRSAGVRTGAVIVSAPGALASPESVTVTFNMRACAESTVTADAIVTAGIGLDDCGAPDRSGSLAKRYRVSANANDTLSLRLTSGAFDAYLTLEDSLGTPLAQNDDCTGTSGSSCILEFRAPAGGRYVIEATTLAPADTGAFALSVVKERVPGTPGSIAQLRADSSTAIVVGAISSDSEAVFRSIVNDPNPRDSVRLELELLPTSSPPSGSPTHQSAYVAAGQTAWIAATGLTENAAYYWRARSCDKTLRCSAWVSFGANADGATDFLVNAVQEDPSLAALSLNQFNGATVVPVGGGLGSGRTVTLKGTVSDPDPGDVLVIQVEVKLTNAGFNGGGLSQGTSVNSDQTASAAVAVTAPLLGSNNYHWRARACDQTGRCGAWSSFGGNADGATDFHVP